MTGPNPPFPHLLIRPARTGDIAPILRLLTDDALGAARDVASDPPETAYLDAFARMQADPDCLLVVGEGPDGRVIATLQLDILTGLSKHGARKALVQAVRVDSALRGRGLGARLMRWAIEEARARGCASIALSTHRSREGAHRFYARLGFEPSHLGMQMPLKPDAP
jgi:GNAT superfamily N-acetyltransferase